VRAVQFRVVRMKRDDAACMSQTVRTTEPCQSLGGGGWGGHEGIDKTPFGQGGYRFSPNSDGEFIFYFLFDPSAQTGGGRPELCRAACPQCCFNVTNAAEAEGVVRALVEGNDIIGPRTA
jgi:hypothetical protein